MRNEILLGLLVLVALSSLVLAQDSAGTYYTKECTYIWDSTPYIQEVNIVASVSDSIGAKDSDSVTINIKNLGPDDTSAEASLAIPQDSSNIILNIVINHPIGSVEPGATEIKTSAIGPNKLGKIALTIQGSNINEEFEISDLNCKTDSFGYSDAIPKSIECKDSDGGLYTGVKGSATGVIWDGTYRENEPDRCVFQGGKLELLEWYCASDNRLALYYYNCPDCKDGVCPKVKVDNEGVTCIDSDGGKDFQTSGKVTFKSQWRDDVFEDYCDFNTAVDYYCDENNIYSIESQYCPNGCSSGVCIGEPLQGCYDTDEGKDIYTKGKTQGYFFGNSFMVDRVDFCFIRHEKVDEFAYECEGENCYLDESFISDQNKCIAKNEIVSCKYGCKDGKCRIAPPKDYTKSTELEECEKYYACPNGLEVLYCSNSKTYDQSGDLAEEVCICRSNPSSLCEEKKTEDKEESSEIKDLGKTSKEEPIICDGCVLGDKCVPIGYRTEGKYCDINSEFNEEKEANLVCENNFECSSNVCVSGKCISSSFIEKILSWFRRLLGF